MRRFKSLCTGVVLFLAMTSSGRAADEDLDHAKTLFTRAETHFGLGEFDQALALYKEAYRKKPLPGFLFNIAQCYRNLGDWSSAVFHYKQYLLRLPQAPNADDVRQLISVCEQQIAEKRAAQKAAAQSPAEDTKRSAADNAGTLSAPAVTPTNNVVRKTGSGKSLLSWPWFWVGTGVTTALLGGGIATAIIAMQKSSEYKRPDTSLERRRDLKDSGEALGISATVMFSLAGAAAVGTAALWYFVWHPTDSQAITLLPQASERGGSVLIRGEF
jgi:tetratricopeptide (TPR) repeat protein